MLSERFIEPHTIDTVESFFLNISDDLDYEDEVINSLNTSWSAKCCLWNLLKSNFEEKIDFWKTISANLVQLFGQ